MTIIKHEPWECPRFHIINAPWLSQCTCKLIIVVKEDYVGDILPEQCTCNAFEAIPKCQSDSDHKWECIGMSAAGDTYQCKICGTIRQYLHDGTVMKA